MDNLEKRRKADRTLRKIALYSVVGLVVLIIAIVAILLTVAFQKSPTVEYFNLPFPTDKLEYYPGDSIVYQVEFKKYTDIPATIARQLICNTSNTRYNRSLNGGVSGIEETPLSVQVETVEVFTSATPMDVPLNTSCRIEITAKYEFNAFHTEYVRGRTQDFKFIVKGQPQTPNVRFKRSNAEDKNTSTGNASTLQPAPVEINNNTTTNNTTVNPPLINIPKTPIIDNILPSDSESNSSENNSRSLPLAPITSPIGGLITNLLK